jgi:uncharacterized membrane protein (Fun14 family)
MSLDNIPPALFTTGSGGIVGFLIGFALKKVMKIVAVIFGLFFTALMYLQYQGILAINWDKLQHISESRLLMIGNLINNIAHTSNITANLAIPLTGGISAGLVLGFSKR